MGEVYRLETADGHFVANVAPMLPLPVGDLLVWGSRVFIRPYDVRSTNPPWREAAMTVVQETEG